ncbi:hypothetical protein GPSY_0712 [Paraglaciecola psychrophila 170]|nr:hypothetical protein GPSY_0712 [Paraglaciecola psychrophila 170]
MSLWQVDRFNDIQSVITLLLNGLRIDLSWLGYLLLLPSMLHPWLMLTRYRDVWLKILKFIFLCVFIVVVFFELATPHLSTNTVFARIDCLLNI